jgi:phytoene/squalene synthetase
MMGVMEFDAGRRGRLASGKEIDDYTRRLSRAVMDGLAYFIGHRYRYPDSSHRYSAVAGAHVTHMLRDAVEDAEAGYFNVPREVLDAGRIAPADFDSPAYRAWVRQRVELARDLFREGKRYIHRLGNLRARLAGLAYCAHFEPVLDAIESCGCILRPAGDLPALFRARSAAVGARQSQGGVR